MHWHDLDREGLQDAMVDFLAENPKSFRREIVEAMTDLGYSKYATDKIMEKCKKDGLIAREGNTQNARWSTK